MFYNSRCLRTISNLSVVHKFNFHINSIFFSKSKNDNTLNDLEESSVSKLLNEAASFEKDNNSEWATTPYPVSPEEITDQEKKKPKFNPLDTSVILFPGQGNIKVGDVKMYTKYPRVKELYDIANEILGYNLLKICLNGPQKILDNTEYNQPATVVMSLAALEKLQEERPRAIEQCVAVAGYSVGELTALIFSGAIPYEEGLRLVAIRAKSMQASSEICAQGMLSCFCSPTAKVSKICEAAEKWSLDIGASNPVCKVAIYSYTQGKVFGGCNEALQYIEKNSRELGLRKVQRLPVSGAFHTKLMEPALKPFSKAVNNISFQEPNAPVYSNYSSKIYPNANTINKYLKKQIISSVKWEQTMQKIYQRSDGTSFPRTFDIGSKGTMKTILKMTNAKAAQSCFVY